MKYLGYIFCIVNVNGPPSWTIVSLKILATIKSRIDGEVGIVGGLEISKKLSKRGGWNSRDGWIISLIIIAMEEFQS